LLADDPAVRHEQAGEAEPHRDAGVHRREPLPGGHEPWLLLGIYQERHGSVLRAAGEGQEKADDAPSP
jgi:hypothetical protein